MHIFSPRAPSPCVQPHSAHARNVVCRVPSLQAMYVLSSYFPPSTKKLRAMHVHGYLVGGAW